MVVKITVIKSWTNEDAAEFEKIVSNVIVSVLTVDQFKEATALVTELIKVNDVFKPYSLYQKDQISKVLKGEIAIARAPVERVMRTLAYYVEDHCENEETYVLKAGFKVKKKAEVSNQPPDVPIGLGGTTTGLPLGSVKLKCKAVKGAKVYKVRMFADTLKDDDKFDKEFTFMNTRTMVISGLESGKRYYFKISAVGAGKRGQSNWSAPISIIPQ